MIKLRQILKEYISTGQLNQVEKHLDKIWAKVGIDVEFTRHFMDRVNDARNGKPISPAELIKIYREIYKKYGKPISQLKSGAEVLLKDMETGQTYIGTGKKKIGEQWREIGQKRHDWLQGRTEKQYADSMTIFLIAAMGILSTVFILTLINN